MEKYKNRIKNWGSSIPNLRIMNDKDWVDLYLFLIHNSIPKGGHFAVLLYHISGLGSPFLKSNSKRKILQMIGSSVLSVRQALDFRGYENFDRYMPEDKSEQVWFKLIDLETREIANKKKVAMTLAEADSKNAKIRDTNHAWVRF